MSHYWDDYVPSAAEIEENKDKEEMRNTKVSTLIEWGATVEDLATILNFKQYDNLALHRFRKLKSK